MAAEVVHRLAIWVAVRRFPSMGGMDSRSLGHDTYICRMQHFVRRYTYVPFRRFLGDVRREFPQRPSTALHITLDSYLRDALQYGIADVVAFLPISQA
jgi:hypothetical protein